MVSVGDTAMTTPLPPSSRRDICTIIIDSATHRRDAPAPMGHSTIWCTTVYGDREEREREKERERERERNRGGARHFYPDTNIHPSPSESRRRRRLRSYSFAFPLKRRMAEKDLYNVGFTYPRVRTPRGTVPPRNSHKSPRSGAPKYHQITIQHRSTRPHTRPARNRLSGA